MIRDWFQSIRALQSTRKLMNILIKDDLELYAKLESRMNRLEENIGDLSERVISLAKISKSFSEILDRLNKQINKVKDEDEKN
jgi:septal ring factor EnvC (AmiA/AmiB activator)